MHYKDRSLPSEESSTPHAQPWDGFAGAPMDVDRPFAPVRTTTAPFDRYPWGHRAGVDQSAASSDSQRSATAGQGVQTFLATQPSAIQLRGSIHRIQIQTAQGGDYHGDDSYARNEDRLDHAVEIDHTQPSHLIGLTAVSRLQEFHKEPANAPNLPRFSAHFIRLNSQNIPVYLVGKHERGPGSLVANNAVREVLKYHFLANLSSESKVTLETLPDDVFRDTKDYFYLAVLVAIHEAKKPLNKAQIIYALENRSPLFANLDKGIKSALFDRQRRLKRLLCHPNGERGLWTFRIPPEWPTGGTTRQNYHREGLFLNLPSGDTTKASITLALGELAAPASHPAPNARSTGEVQTVNVVPGVDQAVFADVIHAHPSSRSQGSFTRTRPMSYSSQSQRDGDTIHGPAVLRAQSNLIDQSLSLPPLHSLIFASGDGHALLGPRAPSARGKLIDQSLSLPPLRGSLDDVALSSSFKRACALPELARFVIEDKRSENLYVHSSNVNPDAKPNPLFLF